MLANFIVAIVPDPRAYFQEMRDTEFKLVEELDLWERKRVAEQEGPVLAWNAIGTVANSGMMGVGNPPVFETTTASHLQSSIRAEIELSVVLIASDAVAGKDGVAIADYATMRGLARTRPPIEEAVVPTILTLFTPGKAAPERLTDYDRAYLAALYHISETTPIHQAMGAIGSRMRRAMAESLAPQRRPKHRRPAPARSPQLQRASGGRLMRIASMLPPVLRPNSVPRS
jgi:hypothetical protein